MTARRRVARYLWDGDPRPFESRPLAVATAIATALAAVGWLGFAVGASGSWPVGWRLVVTVVFATSSVSTAVTAIRWDKR